MSDTRDIVDRLEESLTVLKVGHRQNVADAIAEIARLRTLNAELVEALKGTVSKIEANSCPHEDLYRGGVSLTICQGCGRKWLDNEGGFKPDADDPVVIRARALLEKVTG